MSGSRRTALVAMLGALSLVILYLAALSPTGRLGIVALAGLVPGAAVVSAGLGGGLLCYGVAGVLGLCAAFVVSRPSGSRPGG